MKKLPFFLVSLCTALTLGLAGGGCSDDKDVVAPTPVIKPGTLAAIAAKGGNVTLAYTIDNAIAGQQISATSQEEWMHDFDCSVDGKVTFKADPNTDEERTGTIRLSYPEAESVEVAVRQMSPEESIEIDPTSLEFSAKGGEQKTVKVTSGKEWTLEGEVSWCVPSVREGADGDEVVFEVAEATKKEQTGSFVFKCGKNEATLTVKQLGVQITDDILEAVEDDRFRMFLRENFANPETRKLSPEAAAAIETLEHSGDSENKDSYISSFAGIEYLTGLKHVSLQNSYAESLDLSHASGLETLSLYGFDNLSDLNLDGLTKVTNLSISAPITALDLTKMTDLQFFMVRRSKVEAYNVSNNTKLETLSIDGGAFETIDLSANTELQSVSLGNRLLNKVDVSKLSKLTSLSISYTATDDEIKEFGPIVVPISEVDVTANTALRSLTISNTQLAEIDLSQNFELNYLNLSNNLKLTTIDVSNNMKLNDMSTFNSHNLTKVIMFEGQTIGTRFGFSDDIIEWVALPYPADCTVAISDAKLKQYLIDAYDTDKDGKLSKDETLAVLKIEAAGKGIASFTGMEYFKNIQVLDLSDNDLTELDILTLGELRTLNVSNNALTSLDVSKCVLLETLNASNNELTEVNGISSCKELTEIDLSNNKLTALTAYFMSKLVRIDVSHNELSNGMYGSGGLNVTNNNALKELDFSHNNLYAITLWSSPNIEVLNASYNPEMEGTDHPNFGLRNLAGDYMSSLKSINISGTKAAKMDLTKHTGLQTLIALEMPQACAIELGDAHPSDRQLGDNVTVTENEEGGGITLDESNFPDATFREAVAAAFDTNANGTLSAGELTAATELTLENLEIASLQGIELLTELATLNLFNVTGTNSLFVGMTLPTLTSLEINKYTSGGRLPFETIDLSGMPELERLYINSYPADCALTTLDISANSKLIIDDGTHFYVPSALEEIYVSEAQYQKVYNIMLGSWERYDTKITKK